MNRVSSLTMSAMAAAAALTVGAGGLPSFPVPPASARDRGPRIRPSSNQGFRLGGAERNAPCPCGSGKKAKKCGCGGPKALIRLHDDPALSTVCTPLSEGDDLSFLATMRLACEATGIGVGLAAPQIGVTRRAVWISPTKIGGFFVINPTITWRSGTTRRDEEGCLSFPGVTAEISRHDEVDVEYVDEHWQRHARRFEGWAARIVQHELDHLDGICRVGDAWRARNGNGQAIEETE